MEVPNKSSQEESRSYYIDEAGCLTLFNKYGKVIIGEEGVSRTFMLGMAWVQEVEALEKSFNDLRVGLLNDPYFAKIPSMRADGKKTALSFHAKDDIPEVRREIYRILQTNPSKVFVAFRRKENLIAPERAHKAFTQTRFPEASIYDDLASKVLQRMLHKSDCQIVFSRRGKTDRQNALMAAVEKANRKFQGKHGIVNEYSTSVQVAAPHEHAGLQLVDYYLWALQRLLERGEDRYFSFLSDHYRLVMDLDDTNNKAYGEWYTDSNPLTQEKLKPIYR